MLHIPHYFPEACLESVIERAIEEGKIFELLFSESGRKLLKGWPEEKIRKIILKKLGIKLGEPQKSRKRRV
jgi:hypothetical protein